MPGYLLPAHVRAARAMLRITAEELAKAADVKRATLAWYESGRWRASSEFIHAVGEALHLRGIDWGADKHGRPFVSISVEALEAAESPDLPPRKKPRQRETEFPSVKDEG